MTAIPLKQWCASTIHRSAWPFYLMDRLAHSPRSHTPQWAAEIARLDREMTRERGKLRKQRHD